MATTKEIAWKVFEEMLKPLANERNVHVISTLDFVKVCHCEGVSDNRTIKQYLEMMLVNNWIECEDSALSDLLSATQSLWKYKNCKWRIRSEAKYDEVDKAKMLDMLFPKQQPKQTVS